MNQRLFALLWPNRVLRVLVIVAFMLAALAPSVTAEEKPAGHLGSCECAK